MGPKVSRIPTSKLAEILMNLILVQKREKQPQGQEQQQKEEEEQIDFEIIIVNQVNINEEEQVENNGMGAEQIKLLREELAEEGQDLKEIFIILTHSSLLQIEPREKLPKADFDNQLKESANRVLGIYLKEVDTIPGICDKIYAIGRAIVFKLGKLVESGSGERKKKSAIRGNRWE